MSDSLIILMLVTRRQKRGAEVSASNLSRQLIKSGHQILWVGLYPPGEDILEVEGAVNIDLKGTGKGFLDVSKVRDMIHLVKKYGVNIIQANGSDNLRYALLVKMFIPSVKVVYRNISLVSYWIGNSYVKRKFYSTLFRFVDFVASVGEHSYNDFIKTYKFPLSRIEVIRRGFPVHSLNKELSREKVCNEYSLDQSIFLLVWAGALSTEKDPFLALQIQKMLEEKGYQTHLLVVGRGDLEKPVKDFIDSAKIKNVTLAGYKENLSELLAAGDLCLLTSKIEGVPGVILEAAAQKTPALAVNVGGVSESIIDGKTGYLLNSRDEFGFVEKISGLISNKHFRSQLGNAAFEYMFTEFSETKMGKRFEEVFITLVKLNSMS